MRAMYKGTRMLAGWGIAISMIHSQQLKTDAAAMVTLTASAIVEDSRFEVSYKVANHSGETVLLWDQMIKYDENADEHADMDGAYVFKDGPGVARLVRAQLKLPPDISVFKKEIPYVRIVPPHGSLEGHIKLKLPLYEKSPFYGLPRSWHSEHCDKIRLMIGWSELLPGMKLAPRMLGDFKTQTVLGHWDPPVQKLLEANLQTQVELQTRADSFDRSLPMH